MDQSTANTMRAVRLEAAREAAHICVGSRHVSWLLPRTDISR